MQVIPYAQCLLIYKIETYFRPKLRVMTFLNKPIIHYILISS